MSVRYTVIPALIFIAFVCGCNSSSAVYGSKTVDRELENSDTIRMLWNNRLTKKSWIFLNQDTGLIFEKASHLEEAHEVGNPGDVWPYKYSCSNGDTISASNKAAPSVKAVSWNYSENQWRKNPGYEISTYRDQSRPINPIEFLFKNNAKKAVDSDLLREIGLVFDHWPERFRDGSWNDGLWSFRKGYRLTEFSEIRPFLKVKMDNYSAPILAADGRGAYISVDFRFAYYDEGGKIIRSDLIGVVFANFFNLDFNLNPDDAIFWQDFISDPTSRRILLSAEKLGFDFLGSSRSDDEYRTITFDYMPLIKKYLPEPPEGYTFDDAIVRGLDIYSGARGTDISFWLKGVQLNGMP